MKRIILVALAFALLTGTAYAGELTARVTTPTCDKPRFAFREVNDVHLGLCMYPVPNDEAVAIAQRVLDQEAHPATRNTQRTT